MLQRLPPRPKGSPKTPGSGRKKGSKNKRVSYIVALQRAKADHIERIEFNSRIAMIKALLNAVVTDDYWNESSTALLLKAGQVLTRETLLALPRHLLFSIPVLPATESKLVDIKLKAIREIELITAIRKSD